MALCELCGKTDSLQPVSIEGVQLSVCGHCSKYGQELGNNLKNKAVKKTTINIQPEWRIVDNFSEIINHKRNTKGLTIAEFSALINERESTVSKWQAGIIKPNLKQAKQLEHKLGITLLEKEMEVNNLTPGSKIKNSEFTLGDLIIKTKKRFNIQ